MKRTRRWLHVPEEATSKIMLNTAKPHQMAVGISRGKPKLRFAALLVLQLDLLLLEVLKASSASR